MLGVQAAAVFQNRVWGKAPAFPAVVKSAANDTFEPGQVLDLVSRPASQVSAPPRFASKTWAWTERLENKNPHFVQRDFLKKQLQTNPEIVKAFGSDHPHSGLVLLQYAGDPPAGVKVQGEPVLLVHGANKAGDFWWQDGKEYDGSQALPEKLRADGYQVYALTFAHNQDDNLLQAEQIGTCIDRIKELTGKPQVDLVAHSKGGMAARIYCTDGAKESWMTPFRNDVHKLVLAGSPNGGIDYPFRHSAANLVQFAQKNSDNPLLNAPMTWDKIRWWGVRQDCQDMSYDAKTPDYWPGQAQMLARWDRDYPIGWFEPDWYTTYNGGEGFVSHSQGIDHYIQQGGNLIDKLNHSKLDKRVEVALLAGDNPNIPTILNETGGPSDGLLFVRSALTMPSTDNIVAKDVIHKNHLALVLSDEGQNWIEKALAK